MINRRVFICLTPFLLGVGSGTDHEIINLDHYVGLELIIDYYDDNGKLLYEASSSGRGGWGKGESCC